MNNLFVPYIGNLPASVNIKGHRFIILAREKLALEDHLDLMGADNLREFHNSDLGSEDRLFDDLARTIDGGVVLAPDEVEVADVLEELESELSWVH